MNLPPIILALSAIFISTSAANPVEVPFSTDFSTDFGDFYAPTGNGYNWGHDWRAENYQSWVTVANRSVTASQQALALAEYDFSIKAMIDPVELVGSGHTVGFAARGSSRTFGSYYLADVRPDASTMRILRISGSNTTIAAETALSFSLADLEPFELELTGSNNGGSVLLRLMIRKNGQVNTISGSDNSPLTGSYFGLRNRTNGSGRFENHFDDYELRPLAVIETPVPSIFAPVGDLYTHVSDGTQPTQFPAWSGILPSGGFEGTPTLADVGVYPVSYPGVPQAGRLALDTSVIVPDPDDVIISEFMADNDDTLLDEDGEPSDWIELFNPTLSAIDLTGWHLSDDAAMPSKFPIPNGTMLAPFEFKIVFASAKTIAGHANFKLDAGGGYVALRRADGSIASEFLSYPEQREDISYGAFGDYGQAGYLLDPTPGGANALAGFSGFTKDTKFSESRGFFAAPFTVDVTTSTPGATIVTTTDGTEPTLTNGIASASPATVQITETTVLRAAAFAGGLVPANVDTQTYIFLEDVKTQDAAHAQSSGWPGGSVNGQVFNYGMDADILNRYTDAEFETAMTDIPSISMVTDIANFTDPDSGFWVNPENRGRAWERPVSVELINPDATPGFQIDAGVRLRGGFSRQGTNPKHSFHLYFRSIYGAGKLDYPLFGAEGANTFDALDLRATQGRSWHFSDSTDATFNRDVFARETQRDMGQPYSRSRYYHLYINGQYFGVFQSQERVDADHAASYFGGEKSDYDVIKTRTKPHRVESLDGDPGAWTRLFDAAVAGFASDSAYFAVQGLDPNGDPDPAGENLVDVDNLIDYMLAIFYTGQRDGPVNLGANVPKNFFCFRPRDGSFGFRFYVHDNEDSFQSVTTNSAVNNDTGDRLTFFNPKWLHQQLKANPRYLQRFGDRAHLHLFNDGALSTPAAQARFQSSADELTNAIIGESARWGDFKRSDPYDQQDWQSAVSSKINSWIPQRWSILVGHLRGQNLYPDASAPNFSQHGGQVVPGFNLGIDATAGDVYYTLDGSDPSGPGGILLGAGGADDTLVGAGAGAWNYLVTATAFSDSEVVVGHPSYAVTDWKHPDFDDSNWPTGTAPLGYGGVGSPSWTTQIGDGGTNPRNPTTYLRKDFTVASAANYSELTINVRRDDGAIIYLNGREITRSNMPSGNVAYADYAAGNASSGDETNYFEHSYTLAPGALLDGNNTLAVEIHQGSNISSDLVIDVELLANNVNGSGVVLSENTVVKARALDAGEWSALTEATFFTTVPASAATLVVSEIYYNPPGSSEDGEFLELRNDSPSETIHLDGLQFVAGITFEFPSGTTLAPGETLLLVKSSAVFPGEFVYSGSLGNGGERIALDGIFDFEYGDDAPWPELADGDGRSLVFRGGDPALPGSWRPSSVDGGNPGGSDSTTFSGGDFAVYAFGGNDPSLDTDRSFSFPMNLSADDVTYTVEVSEDLATWIPAVGWSEVGMTPLDGAFVSVTWSAPSAAMPRQFVRVRAAN